MNREAQIDAELLPCPFCGALPAPMTPLFVGCMNTLCGVKPTVHGDSIGDAVERWNRRAFLQTLREGEGVDEAPQEFIDYFVKNYPGPNTIICDPKWHAPKIWRAAMYALKSHPAPAPRQAEGDVADEIALVIALFKGYPDSIAKAEGLGAARRLQKLTASPSQPCGWQGFDVASGPDMTGLHCFECGHVWVCGHTDYICPKCGNLGILHPAPTEAK